MSRPKYDVFLAHASADKPTVRQLCDLLAPLRVFLDERSIPHGASWPAVISDALAASELVVALVSSNPSHFLVAEIQIAITRWQRGEQKLLPVWLDGRVNAEAVVAYGLGPIQGVVVDAGGLAPVAGAVKALVRGPPPVWRALRATDVVRLSAVLAETVPDDKLPERPATADGRRWQGLLTRRFQAGTLDALLDGVWSHCAEPDRLREYADG